MTTSSSIRVKPSSAFGENRANGASAARRAMSRTEHRLVPIGTRDPCGVEAFRVKNPHLE